VNGGSVSFPPQGGNGSVQVNANRDCAWSAQATAGWIHLGASSGQGDGGIPFTVDQNTQPSARGGAIQVSNATEVSVTQAAPPPPPPTPPAPKPPAPAPVPTPPLPPEDSGKPIDLKGKVSGLTGQCPSLAFMVSARIVRTTTDTDFKDLRCNDLRDGREVRVKGVVQADGIVIATKVQKD